MCSVFNICQPDDLLVFVRRVKMNYEFDIYGLIRNMLMVIVLIIGFFSHNWDFVNSLTLYSIATSLIDISVNMKNRN